MATATIIGIASANPLCVSSSTSTSPANGACITAPIIAAAPISAKAPTGVPCQTCVQDTQEPAEHGAGGEKRCEDTARRAATQRQRRDEWLERKEGKQQTHAT